VLMSGCIRINTYFKIILIDNKKLYRKGRYNYDW